MVSNERVSKNLNHHAIYKDFKKHNFFAEWTIIFTLKMNKTPKSMMKCDTNFSQKWRKQIQLGMNLNEASKSVIHSRFWNFYHWFARHGKYFHRMKTMMVYTFQRYFNHMIIKKKHCQCLDVYIFLCVWWTAARISWMRKKRCFMILMVKENILKVACRIRFSLIRI